MRNFYSTVAEDTKMRIVLLSKMERHHILAVPLKAIWKTVLQVSLKKINGLPNLRIVIPWFTVYETHFQRKFTAEGHLFLKRNLRMQSDRYGEKYLRMKFERRFCLGKNACEQFAEITSIICSISLNMSMAMQSFSTIHFESDGVPLSFYLQN